MTDATPDLEDTIDWLQDVLVEYDEDGRIFGTSGAGTLPLAEHIAKAIAAQQVDFCAAHSSDGLYAAVRNNRRLMDMPPQPCTCWMGDDDRG